MKKISYLGALALVFSMVSNANAAGFQLTEYSTTGLGRAFAGIGVAGDDFSATAYNPAGMIFNKTNGVQLGASTVGIRSHAEGSVTYDNGTVVSGRTNPYIVRVLPHGFAQYKLNDRAVLGLGVYTPYGLVTDYDNDWFGATHAGRSSVQVVDVSPALSVNVIEGVNVGAALNIQHIDADLTSAVETNRLSQGFAVPLGGKTHLAGDDDSIGYSAGITVEPFKNKTRFGVSYRSKVDHKLKGKNSVSDALAGNGTTDIFAKITTPEIVILSAWQRLNDKFTLSATARWTRWSQFKSLDIYSKSGKMMSSTYEDWKNTWFYALGLDYQYNENLVLRLGGAYDDTAVKGVEYRTARIPDGRRKWASFGFSWLKNNWQIDGGYSHLFVETVKAKHGATGASKFNAKYDSNANLFSLAVQYKF